MNILILLLTLLLGSPLLTLCSEHAAAIESVNSSLASSVSSALCPTASALTSSVVIIDRDEVEADERRYNHFYERVLNDMQRKKFPDLLKNARQDPLLLMNEFDFYRSLDSQQIQELQSLVDNFLRKLDKTTLIEIIKQQYKAYKELTNLYNAVIRYAAVGKEALEKTCAVRQKLEKDLSLVRREARETTARYVETSSNVISMLTQQVVQLEERLGKLTAEIEAVRKANPQNSETEQLIASSTKVKELLNAQIEKLRRESKQHALTLQAKQAELEKAQRTIKEQQEQLKKKDAETAELIRRKNAEETEAVKKKDAEIAQKNARIAALMEELEDVREKYEKLKEKRKETKKDLKAARKQRDQFELELSATHF